MTPQQATPTPKQTLAQMVRAKYPGSYDDLDDAALESAVKAKYPGVYDDLPTTQAQAPSKTAPTQPKPSGLGTIGDYIRGGIEAGQRTVDSVTGIPGSAAATVGAAKGVGRTVLGAADLLTHGLSRPVTDQARPYVQPQGTAEKVGFSAEQIGEFFVPAAAAGKVKMALSTGRGMLDALIAAGIEGASSAGVQSVQQGNTQGTLPTAIAAGATAGVAQGVGKGLGWLSERIEKSLIKATKADIENGFQISNVYKHQLGGTLSDTYDKTGKKLQDLGQQLKAELAKAGPGGVVPEVDLLKVLADAEAELTKNLPSTFGQNVKIGNTLTGLLDDPVFQNIAKNGKVDLVTANQIKQAIGDLGAWKYGARDADSLAAEKVANAVYSKLRTAIEQSAPAGPTRIASLNKQMGEIIPIRQAVIRRIPVEQRQNVLNMGDLIGFSTGSIGVAILNRLLRSGQVANAAAQAAPGMTGSVAAPLVGGTTSMIRRDE